MRYLKAYAWLLAAVVVMGGSHCADADEFADQVVEFAPVIQNNEPAPPYLEPANALGAPDYPGSTNCTDSGSCSFVSLGDGGSITIQFVDNVLSGSGDPSPDLRIYEIGPDVERTFVEISGDNATWFPVGVVEGATATVDLDSFGYGPSDLFFYVRLTDDPDEGDQTGVRVGADVDAVEALSLIPIPVQSATWGAIKVTF